MPDYQQGKIYKIVCNVTGKVYYGSTIEPTLARRLSNHRQSFKKNKEGTGDILTSSKILENNNYTIVLVELYPCNSKDELLMRERYWIDNFECVNKCRPIINKDEKKQRNMLYNKQYRQIHSKITCECGKIICGYSIARHKKTKIHIEFIQSKIIEN